MQPDYARIKRKIAPPGGSAADFGADGESGDRRMDHATDLKRSQLQNAWRRLFGAASAVGPDQQLILSSTLFGPPGNRAASGFLARYQDSSALPTSRRQGIARPEPLFQYRLVLRKPSRLRPRADEPSQQDRVSQSPPNLNFHVLDLYRFMPRGKLALLQPWPKQDAYEDREYPAQ
jgi:hypothetical protein